MVNLKEKKEYEHKLVDVARVARIVAGGKRFRFRATVVLGNKSGKVGAGIAKGPSVADAISKATRQAKKKLINVPVVSGTIPHAIEVHLGAADVFLKPAREGTGIIAGGAVRAVCELVGIKNILSKIKGSRNKTNNVFATIEALKKLKRLDEISVRRGKKMEDLLPTKIVAAKKEVKKSK